MKRKTAGPSFCASCTRDFAPGAQRHVIDGAVICDRCNSDERLDAKTPEHLQRGYQSAGSFGGMRATIDAGYRKVVKHRPGSHVGLGPLRDPVEPGHALVRHPRRDRDGKSVDRNEAKMLLGDESLVHVKTTNTHHVFQRPRPKADAPTNPLTSIEGFRRKA